MFKKGIVSDTRFESKCLHFDGMVPADGDGVVDDADAACGEPFGYFN